MDAENAAFNEQPGDDLSALAWVHGELRRSLETAHKSLRRYLKDAESARGGDLDAVDPSVLRNARSQLHQGVGALELVGLPAVADVLRASESAVQRLVSKPALVNTAAVEVIERVSYALLDFLARQLARKPVSPVLLFPQYRAALQLAGADRVHPADLWKVDWQWRDLPPDTRARPLAADDEARSTMETEVLALMREPGRAALARMSDLCADLSAGARHPGGSAALATLWQLAAAVFEAQATGLLDTDVYSKRLASRLLAQLRATVRGQSEPSDRLARTCCSSAAMPASLTRPMARRVCRPCAALGGCATIRWPTTRRRDWADSILRKCCWRASAWQRPRMPGRRWPAASSTASAACPSSSRSSASRCSACSPAVTCWRKHCKPP